MPRLIQGHTWTYLAILGEQGSELPVVGDFKDREGSVFLYMPQITHSPIDQSPPWYEAVFHKPATGHLGSQVSSEPIWTP